MVVAVTLSIFFFLTSVNAQDDKEGCVVYALSTINKESVLRKLENENKEPVSVGIIDISHVGEGF